MGVAHRSVAGTNGGNRGGGLKREGEHSVRGVPGGQIMQRSCNLVVLEHHKCCNLRLGFGSFRRRGSDELRQNLCKWWRPNLGLWDLRIEYQRSCGGVTRMSSVFSLQPRLSSFYTKIPQITEKGAMPLRPTAMLAPPADSPLTRSVHMAEGDRHGPTTQSHPNILKGPKRISGLQKILEKNAHA